jgi:hypothetical protein
MKVHWARWPSSGLVHKGVAQGPATTRQRWSGRHARHPGLRWWVQEDPDHPELAELLVLPRRHVVFVQHASEVIVAHHGDQRL